MSLDPSAYDVFGEHTTEHVALDTDVVRDVIVAIGPTLERFPQFGAQVGLACALLFSLENDTPDVVCQQKNLESLMCCARELLEFWRATYKPAPSSKGKRNG